MAYLGRRGTAAPLTSADIPSTVALDSEVDALKTNSSITTLGTVTAGVLGPNVTASHLGISEVDMWLLTATFTGSGSTATNLLSANLARSTVDFEKIGTGMTVSSGIFTFPSTGKWLIQYNLTGQSYHVAGERNQQALIEGISASNSTYHTLAISSNNIAYLGSNVNNHSTCTANCFFDVTSTSSCKVRFSALNHGGTDNAKIRGGTYATTCFIFQKLGAT